VAGTIFRNPDLAKAFRLIQQQGTRRFYKARSAAPSSAKSQALGGPMTAETSPIQGRMGDAGRRRPTTASSPCNGTRAPRRHGASVEALNVLEQCCRRGIRTDARIARPREPLYWHAPDRGEEDRLQDVYGHKRRPERVPVPLYMLTSKPHAASLCSKVNPEPRRHDGIGQGRRGRHRRHDLSRDADRWGTCVV